MTAFIHHFLFEFRTGIRNKQLLFLNYLFPLGIYLMMSYIMAAINPLFLDAMIPAMVIFAILAAFFESIRDLLSKKNLRHLDEYVIAWSLRFFGLLCLLPGLFFTEIPPLKKEFWGALVLSGSLNVMAAVLYMKAISTQICPLQFL